MSTVIVDQATDSVEAAANMERPSPFPKQRRAGVVLHVTSLPGPHGIGEIGGEARRFVDTLADCGLHIWQVLPLGPTGYGDSPYQSLSTFAGNEMLIDMGDLVDMGLLRHRELAELRELPTDQVDYGELIPIKSRLLSTAAHRFEAEASDDLKQACDAFVAEHGPRWLHDYALYRILKYRHGHKAWTEWEKPFLRRDPEAIRYVEEVSADQIAEIKIIQFLFYHQWAQLRAHAAARGVRLFGDMPIYIAFDSADAWSHTELLRVDKNGRPDKVAGVPPDYFSADGQLWGNPLYDWDYHARHGYRWWVERLRHTCTLVDLVRIDHFRGFEGYWAVPAGATTAREGAWEQGPGDAVFEAVQQALGRLPIIAEDLGAITDAVDALRERQRIPGMKVLQFEVGEDGFSIDDIPDRCVCYTGTHDNDTVRGWFVGGNGDVRTEEEILATREAVIEATGGSDDTVHLDLIRLAFASRARIALALMQDFLGLGSEARMNTPGTSSNNWRWRLAANQLTPALRDAILDLVTRTGRN